MEYLPPQTLSLESSCLSMLEDASRAWKERPCSRSTQMQMQLFCISTPFRDRLFGKNNWINVLIIIIQLCFIILLNCNQKIYISLCSVDGSKETARLGRFINDDHITPNCKIKIVSNAVTLFVYYLFQSSICLLSVSIIYFWT